MLNIWNVYLLLIFFMVFNVLIQKLKISNSIFNYYINEIPLLKIIISYFIDNKSLTINYLNKKN